VAKSIHEYLFVNLCLSWNTAHLSLIKQCTVTWHEQLADINDFKYRLNSRFKIKGEAEYVLRFLYSRKESCTCTTLERYITIIILTCIDYSLNTVHESYFYIRQYVNNVYGPMFPLCKVLLWNLFRKISDYF